MEKRAKSGAAAAAAGGLPDDAVLEILSRVPARSLNRFKCVSKPWRDLIADPLHRKRLPQTLEGFFLSDGASVGPGFCGSFISLPGRSATLADPSLSFLTKLPGIRSISLLGSCNGLLLFENGWKPVTDAPAYVVCNPATEEWVVVPSFGCPCPIPLLERTDLIFDLAVSPHFHLVHICQEEFMSEIEVHTYSSETRVWSDRTSQQSQWQDGGLEQWVNGGAMLTSNLGSTFVNGKLHLVIFLVEEYRVAVVDREGKKCRIIPLPDKRSLPLFFGQSQGRLHCVARLEEQERNRLKWVGLSIWVLEDYDTEEWVLKYRASFLELFGQMSCHYGYLNVLAIHPDRNLIFIVHNVQNSYHNQKLISYDMDSKELHAFHTLGHHYAFLTPYVPNFMELLATNEH